MPNFYIPMLVSQTVKNNFGEVVFSAGTSFVILNNATSSRSSVRRTTVGYYIELYELYILGFDGSERCSTS